jgi:hypothetical protein
LFLQVSPNRSYHVFPCAIIFCVGCGSRTSLLSAAGPGMVKGHRPLWRRLESAGLFLTGGGKESPRGEGGRTGHGALVQGPKRPQHWHTVRRSVVPVLGYSKSKGREGQEGNSMSRISAVGVHSGPKSQISLPTLRSPKSEISPFKYLHV